MKYVKLAAVVALAAVSFAAHAGPRDNMFARCQDVMLKRDCRIVLDTGSYPVGGRTLISKVGWVSNESYVKIRNTGMKLESGGTVFTMCAMIEQVCTPDLKETNPATDDCKVVRGSWKQEPLYAAIWERVLVFLGVEKVA